MQCQLNTLLRGKAEQLSFPFSYLLGRNLPEPARRFHLALLCSVHGIGLLVIDEIQEVANIKSGRHEAFIGFFLKLTNRLRIPILMIGTYKANSILFNQLRLARRSCGAGIPEWSHLHKKGEWEVLSKAMWNYQYTRAPVAWSQELSDALYGASQGIGELSQLFFPAVSR
jgi:hypothetical protein